MWTLLPPFAHVRRDLGVVVMLKAFADGTIARLDCPDKVPAAVWSVIEDCLSADPALRPSASVLLSRLENIRAA